MDSINSIISINVEDAFNYIVKCLKEGIKTEYSNFGYDLYIVNVVDRYVIDVLKVNPNNSRAYWSKLSPSFYSAAWELCRRGILRPGVKRHGEQVTNDGSGGDGYSITVSGIEWIKNAISYDLVPIEPGRMSKLLNECSELYGDVYAERSQEAINIVFPYFLCYPLRTYVLFGGLCRILLYSLILLQPAMLATQTHSFALVTQPVSHTQSTKALISHALPEILHITGWLKTIFIIWSWSGTQNIKRCTVTGDRMSLT